MSALSLILAATESVPSLFAGMDQDQKFALIIVGLLCATGLILIISIVAIKYGDRGHRRKLEAELKREMLDRGMSAHEVATVIGAALPPEDAVGRWVNTWCNKK